ncbi:MAG: sensor histidine kinase [Rhizobiaceae bacterium]
MSEQSKNHDKTIVERRVAHAGDQSRLAVKNLRAGIGSGTGIKAQQMDGFEADLLERHACIQKKTLSAAVLVFLVVAGAGLFMVPIIPLALGLVTGLGLSLGNYLMASSYLKTKPEKRNGRNWKKRFVGLRLATGLVWAGIFSLFPMEHIPNSGTTIALVSMLAVCCLALLQSRFIKLGVFLEAGPPMIGCCALLLINMDIECALISILIVTTLLYFQFMADTMRNSYMDYLKARAERDQLIMELEDSHSISEEARRRAEESNLAKSRFLATMSHELRTPLNAILGFSEVMANEVMGPIDNPHYKEYLSDIHRSGTHLLKLINEILDLSRVEAGRYDLNQEATNLAHLAEESQQMIKLKAAKKNVSIVMQIQPDLPELWADARAVRQVILNLLSNALKFTPSGGTIWLKVGWTAGGGQYVSIKDTGPGIPEEEIPIVLSSFGQGSIAIKSAEQGTGLGLPIVQALVHMHEGSFDLKSKLREGTEVIATFPKKRVMEELPAVHVDQQNDRRAANGFSVLRRRVNAPPLSKPETKDVKA